MKGPFAEDDYSKPSLPALSWQRAPAAGSACPPRFPKFLLSLACIASGAGGLYGKGITAVSKVFCALDVQYAATRRREDF